MSAQRLTEDFYRQCNRIVLEALRRKIIVFPEVISERGENKVRKTAGVCAKCGQGFTRNVVIQKYCRECGELEAKERYLKRKNDRIKRKNSTAI